MNQDSASSKTEADLALGLVDLIGLLNGHPEKRRLAVIGEAIVLIAQQNPRLADKLLRFGKFFSEDFEAEAGIEYPSQLARYTLQVLPEEERDVEPLDLDRLLDFTEKEYASPASLALSFIEKIGKMRGLLDEERRSQFFFLLYRVAEYSSLLADKLFMMATAFSDKFYAETHNPPSLCPQTGIHIQLGEAGEFVHTPLEEVLLRLALAPMTGMGGMLRDISGPFDCGNEMRVGPDAPLDISEERDFLLSVLKEE